MQIQIEKRKLTKKLIQTILNVKQIDLLLWLHSEQNKENIEWIKQSIQHNLNSNTYYVENVLYLATLIKLEYIISPDRFTNKVAREYLYDQGILYSKEYIRNTIIPESHYRQKEIVFLKKYHPYLEEDLQQVKRLVISC